MGTASRTPHGPVPEYVPVAGPLMLAVSGDPNTGVVLNLEQLLTSLALPATMLHATAIAACSAHAIVTVENATSFSELIAIRPRPVLAIYTAGFASPTIVSLLERYVRPTLQSRCSTGATWMLAGYGSSHTSVVSWAPLYHSP